MNELRNSVTMNNKISIVEQILTKCSYSELIHCILRALYILSFRIAKLVIIPLILGGIVSLFVSGECAILGYGILIGISIILLPVIISICEVLYYIVVDWFIIDCLGKAMSTQRVANN